MYVLLTLGLFVLLVMASLASTLLVGQALLQSQMIQLDIEKTPAPSVTEATRSRLQPLTA